MSGTDLAADYQAASLVSVQSLAVEGINEATMLHVPCTIVASTIRTSLCISKLVRWPTKREKGDNNLSLT